MWMWMRTTGVLVNECGCGRGNGRRACFLTNVIIIILLSTFTPIVHIPNPIPARYPLEIGRVFETFNPTRSVYYPVLLVPDRRLVHSRSIYARCSVGFMHLLLELVPMDRNPEREVDRVRVVLDRSPLLATTQRCNAMQL